MKTPLALGNGSPIPSRRFKSICRSFPIALSTILQQYCRQKTSKGVHCLNSFNADRVNGLTSTFLLLESLILTVSQEVLNASQHLFSLFLSALRKTSIYESWDPEFVKIFSLSIQDLGGWLGAGWKEEEHISYHRLERFILQNI